MSLITRCPACQTLFKVVPDQLRISEGWVRCGQCDEVFDASLQLLQALPPASQAVVAQDTAGLAEEDPPPVQEALLALTPDAPQAVLPRASLADELPVPDEPVLSGCVSEPLVMTGLHHGNLNLQTEQAGPLMPVEAVSLPSQTSQDLAQMRGAELGDISFLRQANVSDAKPGLIRRATWAFLSVLLVLGLAGQIVLHERDRIAASHPDLQPWLQLLCEPLKCRVSPWRKIDSILIDSATLTRVRDDFYRLSLTLKNTASVPVALPALELGLTNSLDQQMVRRVFFLTELESTSFTIAAGSERLVSLLVSVNPGNDSERIAGYRLLAFYP